VFIITAKKTNAAERRGVHSPKALPPRMVFQTGEQGDSTLVGVIIGCVAKQEAGQEGEQTEEESETDNCDSS
jgi:hypothetical protein